MQAISGFALRRAGIGQPLQQNRGCRARRVNLNAGPSGLRQRLGSFGQRRQIVRRQNLAALVIEQQCRKRGDPGETSAIQRIECIGNSSDICSVEAAFMAAIESISFRPDAGKEVLHITRRSGAFSGFARLVIVEDGPVIRPEDRRSALGLVAGHLLQMTEMADAKGLPGG